MNFFDKIWEGVQWVWNKLTGNDKAAEENLKKLAPSLQQIQTDVSKIGNNIVQNIEQLPQETKDASEVATNGTMEDLREITSNQSTIEEKAEEIKKENPIIQVGQETNENQIIKDKTNENQIIKDKTNENQEIQIGQQTNENLLKLMDEWQKEQWEREDQIRQETQEREDTAWQRSAVDMRKAGINPNLVNATPAASGGGITQATGKESNLLSQQMQQELSKLELMLNNEFKADENQKDRVSQIISTVISIAAMLMLR